MILQALYDYYQRKMQDPDPARLLPVFGWENKEIPFIIELTREGRPTNVVDTRSDSKKKQAHSYLVPKGVKKTSGVAANLLWDTAEYVLGVDTKDKPERVAEQHAAFKKRLAELPEAARQDAGIQAIEAFYAQDFWAELEKLQFPASRWKEEKNPVVTFRLAEDTDLICLRPAIYECVPEDVRLHTELGQTAKCLITGEISPVARLHTAIKGIWGAQTSGANIVSFNKDAFESFNKKQGDNAPVTPFADFAYTTALNHLLSKNSRQRLQVGDASTVFWAQKEDSIEDSFSTIFGETDNPDARTEQVKVVLDAVNTGQFDGGRGDNRFYVLGLAPNAARIAVRFWHAAPLSEIARRIRQWFDDLSIVRGSNDPEYPSLFRLLDSLVPSTVKQDRAKKVPPNLSGDIMRAILNGGVFPISWLNAAVIRSRSEQRCNYLRAATIKAYVNRIVRFQSTFSCEKEITSMLDLSNKSSAYRLGRLFATLEKIQEEAHYPNKLNATIRDRYYGAACSTPVAVFWTLLDKKNHHITKLANRGRAINFERLISEIMWEINNFPAHFSLFEQGLFSVGYYHQREDLFSKTPISIGSQEGEQA